MIKNNKLKGLKVFTESGFKLGYVVDYSLDEFKNIKKLYVKNKFIFFYIGKELIIDSSQIIEIKDYIIVKDAFIKPICYEKA